MTEWYLDPLGIDDGLMSLMGRVTAHWSYIEYLESDFLAHFLDADPGAIYAVTLNVSNSTLTDWLRTLGPTKFKDEALLEELAKLFQLVDELRAERNAYVHGLWSVGDIPGTAMVRTVRWGRDGVIKDELVAPDDLKGLLEGIAELQGALVAVAVKLGFRKP